MKALSIKQPWAWLIVHGPKRIENRNWKYPPTFRGKFLIHTGQQFDMGGYGTAAQLVEASGDPDLMHRFEQVSARGAADFQRGGIIGTARIVDVITESDDPWFFGPLGFVLEDVEPVAFYPCKGNLGFFNVEYPGR